MVGNYTSLDKRQKILYCKQIFNYFYKDKSFYIVNKFLTTFMCRLFQEQARTDKDRQRNVREKGRTREEKELKQVHVWRGKGRQKERRATRYDSSGNTQCVRSQIAHQDTTKCPLH